MHRGHEINHCRNGRRHIECIDEGDKSLAEYKPQISGPPNPFENDTLTDIDDRSVEEYIGEGEDRPGEGKHF